MGNKQKHYWKYIGAPLLTVGLCPDNPWELKILQVKYAFNTLNLCISQLSNTMFNICCVSAFTPMILGLHGIYSLQLSKKESYLYIASLGRDLIQNLKCCFYHDEVRKCQSIQHKPGTVCVTPNKNIDLKLFSIH
jgi:hypothetical protein